jgi:hypothetical protein
LANRVRLRQSASTRRGTLLLESGKSVLFCSGVWTLNNLRGALSGGGMDSDLLRKGSHQRNHDPDVFTGDHFAARGKSTLSIACGQVGMVRWVWSGGCGQVGVVRWVSPSGCAGGCSSEVVLK